MNRRTFVISGICCGLGGVAGCLDAEETEDNPEDGPSADGDHREFRMEAENFTRQADNRIVENGQVSIILEVKNIGSTEEYADVSLQMRDRDGNPIGSVYTEQHGPVEPGAIAEIRFDVEEAESEIGGYELVVRDGQPQESSLTTADSNSLSGPTETGN